MQLHIETSEIYVPDSSPDDPAVAKTTHMGIAAHQDDIEIMAYHGVIECFGASDKNFLGVTVANGSGSPRDDLYADFTDEEMQTVRRVEQKKAAFVGEYCAHVFLDYPSSAVKDPSSADVVADLVKLVEAARPEIVYTHNLADKHDTHVAVALRAIEAIRKLPNGVRPKKLLGCEVWRDLDWLNDQDKVVLNVEAHENLAAALVGIFDSQICGGKRYDLATIGRRRANATYFSTHGVDESASLTFAMDLTPLIQDDEADPESYVRGHIESFAKEVAERMGKLS